MNIKIIKKEEILLSTMPYTIDNKYLPNKEIVLFKFNKRYYVTTYNNGYNFFKNIDTILKRSTSFKIEKEANEFYFFIKEMLSGININTIDYINEKDYLDNLKF